MVKSLMTNVTSPAKQLAAMMQTIEVLKKFVEDKVLQISQLMKKLEVYDKRESIHAPTHPPALFMCRIDNLEHPGFVDLFTKDAYVIQSHGSIQ
ncbi:hypothetical protein RND71_001965 [Anisodus tanguticus]|uniref:Uncharacterized protein n=1 Tax=Anisodus tanguticus TaxID=243964 RepID=A0AAE1T285_9SOLA|nr:hypothetical protein RND71_001965 [Anisodus tanguticus]